MPTIWIIGDSTVEDNTPPFRGWGWALPELVREGVTVKNHALSGRSSRSFRAEGLFEPVERALGEMVRAHEGWRLCAFSGDPSFERNARLKAQKRRRLYNGRLECELMWF